MLFLRLGVGVHRQRRRARRERDAAEGRTRTRRAPAVRGARHCSCDSLVVGPGRGAPRLATPALLVVGYKDRGGRSHQLLIAWAREARTDASWREELEQLEAHRGLRKVHGPCWSGLWRGTLSLQHSRGCRGEDRPLPARGSSVPDNGERGWTVWGPPWRRMPIPVSESPSMDPEEGDDVSSMATIRDTSPEPEEEP